MQAQKARAKYWCNSIVEYLIIGRLRTLRGGAAHTQALTAQSTTIVAQDYHNRDRN